MLFSRILVALDEYLWQRLCETNYEIDWNWISIQNLFRVIKDGKMLNRVVSLECSFLSRNRFRNCCFTSLNQSSWTVRQLRWNVCIGRGLAKPTPRVFRQVSSCSFLSFASKKDFRLICLILLSCILYYGYA